MPSHPQPDVGPLRRSMPTSAKPSITALQRRVEAVLSDVIFWMVFSGLVLLSVFFFFLMVFCWWFGDGFMILFVFLRFFGYING